MKENQALGCYQQLVTRIQKGLLKPGDYLREQVIAEELGVSRTPVRGTAPLGVGRASHFRTPVWDGYSGSFICRGGRAL